jgi:hypothetical protein
MVKADSRRVLTERDMRGAVHAPNDEGQCIHSMIGQSRLAPTLIERGARQGTHRFDAPRQLLSNSAPSGHTLGQS